MKKTIGLLLSLSPVITLVILLIVSPDNKEYSTIPLILLTPVGIHLLRSATSPKTKILSSFLPIIFIILSITAIILLPDIRYTPYIINIVCFFWLLSYLPYSIYIFFKKNIASPAPEPKSPGTCSIFQKIISSKTTHIILLIFIIFTTEYFSHELACGCACNAPFFGLKSWITGWIYPYISLETPDLCLCACNSVIRIPIELTIVLISIISYIIYKIFTKKNPSHSSHNTNNFSDTDNNQQNSGN